MCIGRTKSRRRGYEVGEWERKRTSVGGNRTDENDEEQTGKWERDAKRRRGKGRRRRLTNSLPLESLRVSDMISFDLPCYRLLFVLSLCVCDFGALGALQVRGLMV